VNLETERPISVLIADDQALVRGAFAALVDAVPGMHVVGTAADGAEAVALAAECRPDVVLMDVRMPRMDGIAATREIISADGDGPRVLILTTFDLDEYVFSALRAGAGGFLLKDTPPDDLVTAIRVIAGGEALLAPTVTRRLIEEFARRPEPATAPHQSLDGVTEREREVLVLIGRGMSNSEIAAHLHLAAATVKTHVSRLLMKLCARDRAQLVIAAYESGLLGAAQ
jgi:DNA-binding NarL/FixJ family response regulator